MRASGVLLPISSLPSRYGIGSFSKSGYEFVDFLAAAGQKYWQILPLGPTGYGDSPYQSFSTFAGNPYFIDLDTLISNHLLTESECESYDFGDNKRYIDYEKLYNSRFKVLKLAYERSSIKDNPEFGEFLSENEYWIEDYALYMAVKNSLGGISWCQWPEDIRLRQPEALKEYKIKLAKEIEFYQYIQYEFIKQWRALKAYANNKGIRIIGDIPIYVAYDSADSWANRQLFQFDEEGNPLQVAGCPPDSYSATGQLWGNPLYKWEYHKETSYAWWIRRIEHCFRLYDVVRVDHFRGFDEYYSIPAGNDTAEFGTWMPGPGYDIFEKMEKQLGKMDIIAEDLGYLTSSVLELVAKTGYPGMKIIEFAFDSSGESEYLPYHYNPNCVVYTGTHDNQTLVSWYQELAPEDKWVADNYVNIQRTDGKEYWDFIRLAHGSVAGLVVIPMQDYLGLSDEARMNYPSTLGGNWVWRLLDDEITEELVLQIRQMTKMYGRQFVSL